MILDERDGEIMRTRSRENRDVNDIWLCDKGWFGYEFTYHPDRLQPPMMRWKHFSASKLGRGAVSYSPKMEKAKPTASWPLWEVIHSLWKRTICSKS